MHARLLVPLLLTLQLSALGACGGDDDAPPPSQKPLSPVKAGSSGKGGKSGSSGSNGGSGDGGSGNGAGDGGTSGSSGQTGAGNGGTGNAGGVAGGAGSGGGAASGGAGSGGGSGSAAGGAGGGPGGAAGDGGGGQGQSCVVQGDCSGTPERPLCDVKTGICVECLSSTDCSKDPDKKVCDTQYGWCVECLAESDCNGHPNGPHCEISSNTCTCKNNDECTGSTKGKLCDVKGLHRCSECITAFDCKSAQKPGCSLDNVCFKGDFCKGDDAEEGASDDGPLGATDVTPPVLDPPDFFPPWKLTLDNRHVCDLPVEEADWYKIKVEARDSYEIEVDWADGDIDLDLVVIDGAGRLWGYNYFGHPARVKLTYMPAGTLYAYVYRSSSFDKLSMTPTSYTLRVTRDPEAGKCISNASCAGEYDTQVLRGLCDPGGGVCNFITGDGKLKEGAYCDGDDDCESGQCSFEPFTKDAHARSFCTRPCDPENPCPGGQRCATYSFPEICVAACSSTEQCRVSLSESPGPGLNWKHLTCNTDSGECE